METEELGVNILKVGRRFFILVPSHCVSKPLFNTEMTGCESYEHQLKKIKLAVTLFS